MYGVKMRSIVRLKRLCSWLAFLLFFFVSTAYAVDDGITDYVTIPVGSYIIDMGQPTQTVANGLKPYGLVYDLVKNQKVPVAWAINPTKAKDGVDFSYNAKSYRGGPFIIEGTYVTSAVAAVINSWKAQGVVVDGPTTSTIPSVPIYDRIYSFPNTVLDFAKGSIAAAFYTAAGIPSTAYTYKSPSALSNCDDFYAMPHADPTWGTHSTLLAWINAGGSMWAGCHAVSVLENIDNPATTANPDMNFLSQTGLVPFGLHTTGSPPYSNTPSGGDPAMQFLGSLDAATQNGSEQIYLPKLAGGWRPSTKVLVWDPSQANVPSLSPGEAAVLAYGRAFGNPSAGYIMYEGGHNIGGTAAANVAAQRAYFNTVLLAGISSRVEVTSTMPVTVTSGQTVGVSALVTGGSGSYSYVWGSNGGGSFLPSSTVASPTFTAPTVTTPTTILLRVTVIDSCGRARFVVQPVVVQPLAQADLAVSKTGTSSVAQGGNVNYTLTFTNNGPTSVTGAFLNDTVPAAITGVTWSCVASGSSSCGSASSGSGNAVTLTTGSLGIGAANKLTITVSGTASTAGSITNTVLVAPPGVVSDPVSTNNSSSQTTTVIPPVDLSVTKTGPASIFNGVNYSYSLSVKNNSTITGNNIVVSDVLPTGLSFVSTSGSGWSCGYNSSTRNVSCNLASLAAGATSVITLTVNPTGTIGSSLSNTATVSSLSQPDVITANNTSTATSTFTQPADLSITKTGVASTGGGSQTNTFTITVINNGPGTANSIVITDTLSGPDLSKITSLSSSTASVGTFTASGLTGGSWSIPTLASGASATLTLVYLGDNNNGVTNTVTVTSATHDPVTTNNRAEVTILDGTPTLIDLSISKTASPSSVNYGGTITYGIQITNNSTATDWKGGGRTISITDTLPSGVTYISASGSNWTGCSQSAGVVTCQYNQDINKNGGTSSVLSITVTAPSVPGSLGNTVQLQGSRDKTIDPDVSNNTATANITVLRPNADIQVSKAVDNAAPNLGSNVTFTITARNNGPTTATGVWLSDALPSGLTYVSSTPSQGSYNAGTGEWLVGSLNNGSSATLTLIATVTSTSSITNTAGLSSLDQNDPTPANNSASTSVAAVAADLTISKTVNNATPNLGDNVVFTITLTNNGPSASSGISAQDLLLSGLEYVSHTASAGTYNNATGLWSGLLLSNGASATLTITAKVTTSLSIPNAAFVMTSSVVDPNPVNDTAGVSVQGQQVDIALTKTVDNDKPLVLGTPLTFTITAKNNGPSQATNVVVRDVLPSGLSYVSSTPSQGSYVSGTGQWSVGTLASGSSATLQITATNTVNGALANTASYQSSDQPDSNSANNSASVQVLSGGSADLALTKVVDDPSPVLGSQVIFNLTLENYGPNSATGILVQDILPSGLVYVSSTPSQGSYDALTGAWTVGTLLLGQEATLSIVVDTTVVGFQDNQALVLSLDQADPDTTNNDSLASVDVRPLVNLAINKTGPSSVTQNDSVGYVLTVTNAGPSDVTTAVIADTVPANLTSVTWTCVATGSSSCGSASGSGNSISLTGDIAAGVGNALTINVTGTATTPGSITNTATVTPPVGTTDSDGSDNSSSVNTTIAPLVTDVDLAIAKTSNLSGPQVGDTVTYTVTVQNLSTTNATGVVVTDTFPVDLTFVETVGCAEDPNFLTASNVTCSLGNLNAGATTSFTVEGIVIDQGLPGDDDDSGRAITNSVNITATQSDSNTSNNTSSVVITVSQFQLYKEVRNVTAGGAFMTSVSGKPGDVLEYRINYTRTGPPIFDILLDDTLDANTTLEQNSYGVSLDKEITLHCPNGTDVFLETGAATTLSIDLVAECTLNAASDATSTLREALLNGETGFFLFRARIQ